MPRKLHLLLIILPALLTAGCATVEGEKHPDDPFEGYNRAMYAFNDDFDRALFKPTAEGYDKVMPTPLNNGISNFFSNLGDVGVVVNDLLQLKFEQGLSDLGRLTWNTTVGLFGFIDVASHMGLPKHNEDFGQTLGYWGMDSGPYLVLPFLGPSSVRDGSARVVDWQTAPLKYHDSERDRWALGLTNAVDTRAGLLQASRMMDSAALDPYAFMRSAYLQRRENLVHDGNPPQAEESFDPFDDDDFDPFADDPPPQTP
ncbi:MAG: MlaA family lipoprotein [Pseudomonadota bacterium]